MRETTQHPPAASARITGFSRRRGRPRNDRPQVDTGTPETVMKRLLGVTSEALDLCLERKIISQKQHWYGIHLRWLYTLRHGVPSVRAVNLSHIPIEGTGIKLEDPAWRAAREKEYTTAINMLSKNGYAALLLNLCVYNERPKFLSASPSAPKSIDEKTRKHISALHDAFDILDVLWKTR